MAPTNKIIASLKERIGKEKEKESGFEKDRLLHRNEQTTITARMDKIRDQIGALRDSKRAAKEAFYGAMCDFEIEQAFLKDVKWIAATKTMVMEREQRNEQRQQERKERAEQRKKALEERKRREDEYKA